MARTVSANPGDAWFLFWDFYGLSDQDLINFVGSNIGVDAVYGNPCINAFEGNGAGYLANTFAVDTTAANTFSAQQYHDLQITTPAAGAGTYAPVIGFEQWRNYANFQADMQNLWEIWIQHWLTPTTAQLSHTDANVAVVSGKTVNVQTKTLILFETAPYTGDSWSLKLEVSNPYTNGNFVPTGPRLPWVDPFYFNAGDIPATVDSINAAADALARFCGSVVTVGTHQGKILGMIQGTVDQIPVETGTLDDALSRLAYAFERLAMVRTLIPSNTANAQLSLPSGVIMK